MLPEKNILDVIQRANEKMEGRWPALVGACVLCMATLALLLFFPIFGLALCAFAWGFISLGFTSYIFQFLKGESTPVETIFSKYKQILSAFCLKVLQIFYISVWSLLCIVPGIICALNYAFACCVMSEENCDALTAMKKSKEMVFGHRLQLFYLYAYIFLITALVFCFSMIIPFFVSLFASIPLWSLFVMAAAITFAVFALFILPFSEVILVSYYLEIKNDKTVIPKRKLKIIRPKDVEERDVLELSPEFKKDEENKK